MTAPVRAIVLAMIGSLAMTSTAEARECEGVQARDRMETDGHVLVLNGMGVREATVFNVNVYVASLYVESRSREANAILTGGAKHLELRFVRDVDRSDLVDAMSSGFRQSAGGAYGRLQARLSRLNGWLPDVDEGSRIAFTYVPGVGLRVTVGSRVRGVIDGDDFARAFFAIWLGQNPPNPGLRAGLLGGRCGGE
jgi:hypothetical protein